LFQINISQFLFIRIFEQKNTRSLADLIFRALQDLGKKSKMKKSFSFIYKFSPVTI